MKFLGTKSVLLFCVLFSALGLCCEDDQVWTLIVEKKKGKKVKKKVKTCSWIGGKPNKRCRKVGENGVKASVACAKSCDTCIEVPNPQPTPTPTEISTTTPLPTNSNGCPVVSVVEDFNIDEYIRKSWFVQKQQVNGYQPENALYCVAATYESEGKGVPFFWGTVISVYNYGNVNEVNGRNQNDSNGMVLCARQPDENTPAKLLVAPCFLPNFLAGDYWVVAAGPSPSNYEWAIISGGQPTEKYDDGCTTKESGINGSGFWFFTRAKVASEETLAEMESVARNLGFTTSLLKDVAQEGCNYEGANLK